MSTENMAKDLAPKANDLSSWLEMNRSLSLFFAITRLLASTALIILIASNPEPLYAILMVDTDTGMKLEGITSAFSIAFIAVLVKFTVSSVLGIWGYARLNRHLLTFYGSVLLLTLIWGTYFFILLATHNPVNTNRIRIYKRYALSKKTRVSIQILQQEHKCCGIKGYRFENVLPLPSSCCPSDNKTEECTEEKAFESRCSITRHNVYQSLKAAGVIAALPYICLIWFASTLLEAFLSYNMVYHLSYLQFDDY